MSAEAFFDTNILIYALAANEPRTPVAEALLAKGGVISVQVLNKLVAVARRKLDYDWPDVREALSAIRVLCGEPLAVDDAVHRAAVDLAEAHKLNLYDALIVAAALRAGCSVLHTEDLQHGRRFEGGLTVDNPFIR